MTTAPRIPLFDYTQIDLTKPTYFVDVSDVVHGSIVSSFDIVRDWSMHSPFWSKSLKITDVVDKGSSDGLHNIRYFTMNNRTYSESLIDVNIPERHFSYGLLSMTPALLKGAVTRVSFTAAKEGCFKVKWECLFQPSFNTPALVALIKGGQIAAYKKLIAAVQFINKPILGVASVAITSGTARLSPSYMNIRVGHGAPTVVKTNNDGSPRDLSHGEHTIMSYDDQLILTLYSRSILGNDSLIATGYLPVRELKDKRSCPTITVKDTANKDVGTYKFITIVRWTQPEPTDDAREFGLAAFAVFDVIKREVMKIAVNSINNRDPAAKFQYSKHELALGPMPKFCTVLPAAEAIPPKRVAQLFQRSTEYIYSQAPVLGLMGIMSSLQKLPDYESKMEGEKVLTSAVHLLKDPFLAPFQGRWMSEPKLLLHNLKDSVGADLEFCAQLIRGANPMMITMVDSVEDIPLDLHTLYCPRGRDIKTMISEKCLMYCDYDVLGVGDYDEALGAYTNQASNITGTGTMGPQKFWYTPFLAVYKNEDGRLDILGFILTRFTDRPNTVYSREKTPKNIYKLAKLHLACADNQEHQFVEHLGFAHLCMEPFAIANHNAFPPGLNRHPIGLLLAPHFQDTIGINFLARQTLVSEVAPFTDTTFSTGTTNGLRIFSKAFHRWDFVENSFPNALKRRGFDEKRSDGLLGFYYRDDGFKLWNVMMRHFTRIITQLYGSDASVALDPALLLWCKEMRDPDKAAISSFPKAFHSIKKLAEAVTTIVFQCSAQHAAVNYSQLRYVTYVPNRPDSMRLPMIDPKDGCDDLEEDALYAALPGMAAGQFQTMFAYLLTTPPDNSFKGYDTFADRFPQQVQQFMVELEELSKEIRERNKMLVKSGSIPYEYLDPMGLAQSINI